LGGDRGGGPTTVRDLKSYDKRGVERRKGKQRKRSKTKRKGSKKARPGKKKKREGTYLEDSALQHGERSW